MQIVSLLNKRWSRVKVANELLKARAISGEFSHPGGWAAASEDRSELCIREIFIEDPGYSESCEDVRLL